MDYAERTNDGGSTALIDGQELGDDGKRPVSTAAIRIDERASGGAKPCASNRIAHQAEHRLLELAFGADLNGGAVGDERVGDFAEILHVRPKDDRLAVGGWLQDVVAADRHEAAANENGCRDLVQLRQL